MAQDLQNIESIFDFFYLDHTKIKSFYAQLNGSGALTSIKKTKHIADAKKAEVSVGIPTVTGGKMSTDHSANSSAEHGYDGVPTMPREMINGLDALGYIYRDLIPENLGSLVLLNGCLNVTDVEVMKGIIKPSVDYMAEQMPSRTREDKKKAIQFKNQMRPLLDFIAQVPFALSCSLYVKNPNHQNLTEVWMSLSRDDISSQVHDISFKHGDKLAGQWYVLGVLDAIPNSLQSAKENIPDHDGFGQFKKSASEMLQMFGRHPESYGITPIAIFRVSKPENKS